MFNKKKKQSHNSDELLNDLMNNLNNNPNQGFPNGQNSPFPDFNNQQQSSFNQQQGMGGFQQFPNQNQGFNQPNNNFSNFDVNNQQPNNMQNQNHYNQMNSQPQSQPDYNNQFQQAPMQNQFPNMNYGANQNQQNASQMSDLQFEFPNQSQSNSELDQRINNLDFISGNQPHNDGSSNFHIEEPKNLNEAKQYIYKLVEKIHYLEATLVSLSSNYDNERNLAKKQGGSLKKNTGKLVNLIQDVLQQEKYRYEKEHGSISEKSFDELVDFLKTNLKTVISDEKRKNAKLFTLLKETEEKNKRLESQLSMSSPSVDTNVQQASNNESGVYSNVTNIDKINSILGNQSTPLDSPTQNGGNNQPKENVIHDKKVDNMKVNAIKEEIAAFNSEINKVSLQKNEEEVFKAIGQTGVDNNDSLINQVQHLKGSMNPNSFKTMIYNHRKKLIEKKLLTTYSLELPIKGYRNVELFELSELGVSLYKELYSINPVQSYLVKRKNQHTSYEHSFTIEKVAEHLLLNKYEVITDEKELRFPVEVDGKKYHVEFDLIAKKNGEEYYIEVEMGTTKQSDFNDKCDKNYAFNKVNNNPIVIVSPSKQKADSNLKKVNNWLSIRGGYKTFHKEKKLKVLLPYFDEIKSNRWTDKLEFFIDLTK